MKQVLNEINGELWLRSKSTDTVQIQFRIKEVLLDEMVSSKHLLILESYDFGKILVIDGEIITTTSDGLIWKEMMAHVPLSLHPNAKKVLIIGGDDCGTVREVVKYNSVEQIDFIEIDEYVVQVSKQFLPEVSGNVTDPRINYMYIEGNEFIPFFQNFYDVIIIESNHHKWFNSCRYQDLDQALCSEGIMVTHGLDPLFYYDQVEQIVHHMRSRFPYTHLYLAPLGSLQGIKSFTIGSKQRYEMDHTKFDKHTQYVNQDILKNCFQLPEYLRSLSKTQLLEN